MASTTQEIAERLKGLREMMEITPETMAKACGLSKEVYLEHEQGKIDFSVTMLCNCAEKFGVDVTALFTGNTPKLNRFTIVRSKEGLNVQRRHSFNYEHLAYNFKDREAEPFFVSAPFNEEEQNKPIKLSSHKGQEMDFILSGSLKIEVDGKQEILREGDSIYYDSSLPHGMIAIDNKECKFLAILMKKN